MLFTIFVMAAVYGLVFLCIKSGNGAVPITSLYDYKMKNPHPSVPEPMVEFTSNSHDTCIGSAIFIGAPIGVGLAFGLPAVMLLGFFFAVYLISIHFSSAGSRNEVLQERFRWLLQKYIADTNAAIDRDRQVVRDAEHAAHLRKLAEDYRRELKALEATNAGLRFRFQQEIERDT